MYPKKYFLIKDRLVPFIEGSSFSLGNRGFTSQYSEPLNNSSDILFLHIALGEGPIYRVNPNGPQDIEINDLFIDDLLLRNSRDLDPRLFATASFNGTLSQPTLSNFFTSFSNKIYFDNPKILRSGVSTNAALTPTTAPFASIDAYPTTNEESLTPIDSIKVLLEISSLKDEEIDPGLVTVSVRIFDPNNYNGFDSDYLAESLATFTGYIESPRKVDVEIPIPNDKKLPGYLVSIRKTTPDVGEPGFSSEISAIGFEEIRGAYFSYPRTATVGYAVKSSELRNRSIPTFTTALKGLLVDVPSNYNQPTLESGEVDWREIEVPSNYITSLGYSTQQYGYSTSSDITIYPGIWDGTFKKDWSQNPVWIIYALLTNTEWGLGVPSSAINKFNFYNIAQYCDAVDSTTGNFIGVDGISDGTFRYKPRGLFPSGIETLLGLPEGTLVKERRFICDISIADNTDAITIIDSILATMRATLIDSGGKFSLVIDRPDQTPVAVFNETNIVENSFSVSGIRQDEKITGVEVSYINYANHFKKDSLIEDDPSFDFMPSERERFDLAGCSRKGQALRFAKYIINNSKKVKRRVRFSATHGANDLEIGDVITVSNGITGLPYGFGGQISSDSVIGDSNVYLEHFTSPSIDDSFFTSNTSPLVLKVFTKENNRLNYYIVSNTDFSTSNANTSTGDSDYRLVVDSFFNNSTTSSFSGFSSNNIPKTNDLWALGEVTKHSSKDFRIESLNTSQDGVVSIVATEYRPEIFSDSESLADEEAVSIIDSNADYFKTPPIPSSFGVFNITRNNQGVVRYDIQLSRGVDVTSYNAPVKVFSEVNKVSDIVEVI